MSRSNMADSYKRTQRIREAFYKKRKKIHRRTYRLEYKQESRHRGANTERKTQRGIVTVG